MRALRDKLIEKFYLGKSFVSWYYRAGPKGASWLNHHAGWKPLVRAGLIVPVSISKILFTSKFYHKLAVVLLMMGCFAFAYGAGRHEDWTTSRTIFVGSAIAFFAIIVYGIVMKPEFARADRTDTQLDSQRVYFLYEDHIGRPVLMSEYADYEEDGSYFTDDNKNGYPYWQVYYNMPFGATDYWASTGITIGDPNTTGIVWLVPFRFPGQYQDFADNLDLFYNWNRWYMPGMGRYGSSDSEIGILYYKLFGIQAQNFLSFTYIYSNNNPLLFSDESGLQSSPQNYPDQLVWIDKDCGAKQVPGPSGCFDTSGVRKCGCCYWVFCGKYYPPNGYGYNKKDFENGTMDHQLFDASDENCNENCQNSCNQYKNSANRSQKPCIFKIFYSHPPGGDVK